MLKGILLVDSEGKQVVFKVLEKVLETAEFRNVLQRELLSASDQLLKEKIENYVFYKKVLDGYHIGLIFDSDRIGTRTYANLVHGLIKYYSRRADLSDTKNIKVLEKKIEEIFAPKTPELEHFLNIARSVISRARKEELVSYSLTLYSKIERPRENQDRFLTPYKVVHFEDGLKRALAAAFNGDLIEAFRLGLGALEHKWDDLAALFTFYVGLQLRDFSSDYPAPSLKLLRKILKKVKPKNRVISILLGFAEIALKAEERYDKFLELKLYLKDHIDEIYEIFLKEKDVFQNDILAYILSTVDPNVLTRRKIMGLNRYIGLRSMILGAYLKSALDRLRSFSIIGARELYVKDVLGYIRLVRSKFLNARSELVELLKRGLEYYDKKAREVLINYVSSLTDYLRSIYYSFTIREFEFEKVSSLLREALRDVVEGLKIAIEKPPPVSLDVLFEPIEYASLLLFYADPYLEDTEKEELMRGVLNLLASLYIVLKRNILQGRLASWWLTRCPILLWFSAMFSSKIEEFHPFIVPMFEDVYNIIKRGKKLLLKTSKDSYALALMSTIATSAYLASILDLETKIDVSEKLSKLFIDAMLWTFSTRIYQIPLIISIIDALTKLFYEVKIEDGELINLVLYAMIEGLLNENIGKMRKKVLYDRLDRLKREVD